MKCIDEEETKAIKLFGELAEGSALETNPAIDTPVLMHVSEHVGSKP